MTPYNPAGNNKGIVTLFTPYGLDKLVDFSLLWYVDPVLIGNIILQKTLGAHYGQFPDVDGIVNEIPDSACYAVGYVDDYSYARNVLLTDYVTVFYHTLICMFVTNEQTAMLSSEMQLLKLSTMGVFIYHEL